MSVEQGIIIIDNNMNDYEEEMKVDNEKKTETLYTLYINDEEICNTSTLEKARENLDDFLFQFKLENTDRNFYIEEKILENNFMFILSSTPKFFGITCERVDVFAEIEVN